MLKSDSFMNPKLLYSPSEYYDYGKYIILDDLDIYNPYKSYKNSLS